MADGVLPDFARQANHKPEASVDLSGRFIRFNNKAYSGLARC